jgi:hypothetical protein
MPHQRARWFCVAYRASVSSRRREEIGQIRGANSPVYGSPVGHASASRLEKPNAARQPAHTTQTRSGMVNGFSGRGDMDNTARWTGYDGRRQWSQKNATGNRARTQPKQAKPRLGRGANGLPRALDFHRFPAPPGPQHRWEPPRTTQQREHRAARLKALGNSVVPQVVYPLAVMIREWLDLHGV